MAMTKRQQQQVWRYLTNASSLNLDKLIKGTILMDIEHHGDRSLNDLTELSQTILQAMKLRWMKCLQELEEEKLIREVSGTYLIPHYIET